MRRLVSIFFAASLVAAPAAAKVTPAGAAEKPTDSANRMICKRFTRTGTLAAIEKVCRTKHEWELERANLRANDQIDSCRTRGSNGMDC